jgi:hypothetical protein
MYLFISFIGVCGGVLYFAHSTFGFQAGEAGGLPFLDRTPSKLVPEQQRQRT